MTNQKLNMTAAEYLAGEVYFDELFDIFQNVYGRKYEVIAIAQGLDINEVQAAHEDALLITLDKFDPRKGVFSHYLNVVIKNNLGKLRKEITKRREREVLYPTLANEDGIGNIFHTIENGEDVEGQILDKEIGDKRTRLIAEMVSNADPAIKNILKEILAGHSVHSAAKRCGICHKTVKRRLDKMSALYDANKHGDIWDYLTT